MYRLIFIALLLPIISYATIYKHTDASGTTVFSDQPLPGTKEIQLADSGLYQMNLPQAVPLTLPTPSSAASATAETAAVVNYTISISLPDAQEDTLYMKDGFQTVIANVQPAISTTQEAALLVDGKQYATAAAMKGASSVQFNMNNLDGGEHTLQVQIGKSKSPVKTITMFQVRNRLIKIQPVP